MSHDVNGRKKHQSQLLQTLEENLTLKSRVSSLEESLRFSRGERADLELKLRHLTSNSHQTEVRMAGLAIHCHELEAVLSASNRLLAALNLEDAIQAIQDIVANVIGSESMALFAMQEQSSGLEAIAWCGVTEEQCWQATTEEGVVARVWRSGVASFPRSGDSGITACVPLRAKRQVVAVLAVFSLLPQKMRLEPLDLAVMRFLEQHAGGLLIARPRRNGEKQR